MEAVLKEKVSTIDRIIARMKDTADSTLMSMLKEEIDKLKQLNKEYERMLHRKRVKTKEETDSKVKYVLSDGSVYVIHKIKQYKYLYDAHTGVVTYEFSNGQIERTFPAGIKEIRGIDGKIVIKNAEKEYDVVN